MKNIFIFLILITCLACAKAELEFASPEGTTITTRFLPPAGYTRTEEAEGSYGTYLRTLPLKPFGTLVKYYDGSFKANHNIYAAVVDMDISPRDLQQCADAVMRLRGEYLFSQKKYNEINFNFVSDGKPRYYKDYAKEDYSYAKFLKYMDYIFAYANTTSLYNELKAVKFDSMQIGDVLIQKGRPYGHAVIVVDMAENAEGKKVYMLAQSYMPAQETQVLLNPMDKNLSPWYELKEGTIKTPEWTFKTKDLRRF